MRKRINKLMLIPLLLILFLSLSYADDYLIYDPCDLESASDLQVILHELDYSGVMTDNIENYLDNLNNYEVLFVITNYWCDGFDQELVDRIASDIHNYLNKGGAIYWEGENTPLLNDEFRDEIFQFDIATCATQPSQQIWGCSESPFDIELTTETIYAEMIDGGDGSAFEGEDICWCKGIYRESPFRGILTTFPISSLTDDGENTRAEFVYEIMSWLTNSTYISDMDVQLPSKITALAAYPNPFNAVTRINYNLSKPAEIKIIVYNILGQPVETVFEGYSQAGENNVSWNAAQYSTGVYFVRLESDMSTRCEKLILLK